MLLMMVTTVLGCLVHRLILLQIPCSGHLFRSSVQKICSESVFRIWQDQGHVRLLASCWHAEHDRFTLSWLLTLIYTHVHMSDVCHVNGCFYF